ncbi:MAG TPA: S9 family peptidase [Thermoguttaceae bacterium]|nr:S9 family peptidase [Thermoguttaceae bacterium]
MIRRNRFDRHTDRQPAAYRTLPAATGLAVALLLYAGAGLSAEGELFSPGHVARLKSVTSAAVSPDGKHVAYTLSVQRRPVKDDDGSAWSELWVVDAQGDARPFVTGKVNVGSVRWTPDGRGIAFLAKRGEDEHTSLYQIPIDGGEAKRLFEHDADLDGPSFSRDGQRLAFLATEPRSKEQQERRDKGFDQEIYEEDWRPRKVWLAAADGSGKPEALELEGSASLVAWSPGGRQLVVVLAPTPLVDDGYMSKRVYVVDADTGKVVEPIRNPGKLGQVGWSPDGKHLAMISGVDIHDPRDGRLMVAEVPGDGTLRDLMPDYEAHVHSFAWKDAETLLWVAYEGTASTVGTVTLDGRRRVLVDGTGPVLASLSLSDDGRTAALVGHAPGHPGEVFLLGTRDGVPRRLTRSNPWLADMRLAEQEVVRHKARDGLELEGILVYPVNYQEGRRYPLILCVHGGPESHVSNGWVTSYSRPGQTGAARGFAVFYPNYRGSTGRGVAFSKMGQADAAGREFDDLVDAVDHLVGVGLVDHEKVGITGGSYGGYASAWGATYYSDRFAASVMFVGISDNVSKLGTTDIPEEMFLVHHRKRLWEDWDYFLNRSPIKYVARNRTPTLILHGKSDPRVHPSQSMELYRHLKTLGQAPARLVFYPGEGHGNRRAASRFDYNVRMLRWMAHYLQGPGGDPPEYAIDYAEELGDDE